MKRLYLCTSMHYQELAEAGCPQDARTFMMNAHPEDGEYNVYLATEDDQRLFATAQRTELTVRKRYRPEQLDWVGDQAEKRKKVMP